MQHPTAQEFRKKLREATPEERPALLNEMVMLGGELLAYAAAQDPRLVAVALEALGELPPFRKN